MIGKALGFFKGPVGAVIGFLILAGIIYYFVSETKERREKSRQGRDRTVRIGEMRPEAKERDPKKPQTIQWVNDTKLNRFIPKKRKERPVERKEEKKSAQQNTKQQEKKEEPKPQELPRMIHGNFSSPDIKLPESLSISAPDVFLPSGTLIPCKLVNSIESSNLASPVIGLITKDVWYKQRVIIPAATEVHAVARNGRLRDRVEINGDWKFIWNDGKEYKILGVALDRETNADGSGYGITDGSAGIRGRIVKSDEYLEYKIMLTQAFSAAVSSSQETVDTIFGSQPRNNLENAALSGVSSAAQTYIQLITEQIKDELTFVRVPAGTEFYIYTTQVFEPKLASVAGLRQGDRPVNSWLLRQEQYQTELQQAAQQQQLEAQQAQAYAQQRALQAKQQQENQKQSERQAKLDRIRGVLTNLRSKRGSE